MYNHLIITAENRSILQNFTAGVWPKADAFKAVILMKGDKPLSCAIFAVADNAVTLSHIYTTPDECCKNYATNLLIWAMTAGLEFLNNPGSLSVADLQENQKGFFLKSGFTADHENPHKFTLTINNKTRARLQDKILNDAPNSLLCCISRAFPLKPIRLANDSSVYDKLSALQTFLVYKNMHPNPDDDGFPIAQFWKKTIISNGREVPITAKALLNIQGDRSVRLEQLPTIELAFPGTSLRRAYAQAHELLVQSNLDDIKKIAAEYIMHLYAGPVAIAKMKDAEFKCIFLMGAIHAWLLWAQIYQLLYDSRVIALGSFSTFYPQRIIEQCLVSNPQLMTTQSNEKLATDFFELSNGDSLRLYLAPFYLSVLIGIVLHMAWSPDQRFVKIRRILNFFGDILLMWALNSFLTHDVQPMYFEIQEKLLQFAGAELNFQQLSHEPCAQLFEKSFVHIPNPSIWTLGITNLIMPFIICEFFMTGIGIGLARFYLNKTYQQIMQTHQQEYVEAVRKLQEPIAIDFDDDDNVSPVQRSPAL